jgi:hypothetical protein
VLLLYLFIFHIVIIAKEYFFMMTYQNYKRIICNFFRKHCFKFVEVWSIIAKQSFSNLLLDEKGFDLLSYCKSFNY